MYVCVGAKSEFKYKDVIGDDDIVVEGDEVEEGTHTT